MANQVTATESKLFTAEELAVMRDTGPCELINGRIVPMTPTGDEHGAIEANIAAELRAYARDHNLGKVRSGEVGVFVRRNPDTVRAADVLYISHERYARKTSNVFLDVEPELIVEILSERQLDLSHSEAPRLFCHWRADGLGSRPGRPHDLRLLIPD